MPHDTPHALTPRPDVPARPKLEGGRRFVMRTDFQPAGDQPTAIAEPSRGRAALQGLNVLAGRRRACIHPKA
jgi:excinuclease ABC subunit B